MANVALLQKDDDCITCALSCGADFPFILPGAASGAPNEARYSSPPLLTLRLTLRLTPWLLYSERADAPLWQQAVAAVGIVSSGVPQSCSGRTYSPSFICVSGGSLPGFYIKATSGLLAGATLVLCGSLYGSLYGSPL